MYFTYLIVIMMLKDVTIKKESRTSLYIKDSICSKMLDLKGPPRQGTKFPQLLVIHIWD